MHCPVVCLLHHLAVPHLPVHQLEAVVLVSWCRAGGANKDALILLADMRAHSTRKTNLTGMGVVHRMVFRIMGRNHHIAEPHAALLVAPHNQFAGVLVILISGLLVAHHSTARSLTSKEQESSSCLSQL